MSNWHSSASIISFISLSYTHTRLTAFCPGLFYVSTFYFILWAAVSAAYSALLSSSYFERINDDDDDDDDYPGEPVPER